MFAVLRRENARRSGMAGEHRDSVQRRGHQLLGDTSRVRRSARHVSARLPGRHLHEDCDPVDQRKFLRRPHRPMGQDQPVDVSNYAV